MSGGDDRVVALDAGVDHERAAGRRPTSTDRHRRRAGGELEDAPGDAADLLVVACAGYSDRALVLIDGAAQGAPRPAGRRALRGLAERVRPPCLRGGRRRHRRAPGRSRHGHRSLRAPEGDRPRRRAALAGDGALGKLICVLGPKGGTGKTLTSCNLAVGARRRRAQHGRGRRPRPPVRRRRARARAVAGAHDLRPRHVRRVARRREARRLPGDARVRGARAARADPARPGQRRSRSSSCASVYAMLRVALRLRDRRHAARLHARGDRVDRQLVGHLHGRDARLAVAEEHEARASRRSS